MSVFQKIKCAIGIHEYMDLQRQYERFGQEAVEECIYCFKHRCVFRPFWSKDGPMHPRVQK